eukprot:TRINITY_DN50518_c0_g1_i1.p1 TRINITY_DN50518_c0_g1~~TRINITY_DN50518_c0_g1_i1.p1  ORF type:complete len:245 (-),score=20.62 TRINITY_DN50518_c0_g1_i1:77-811(-)
MFGLRRHNVIVLALIIFIIVSSRLCQARLPAPLNDTCPLPYPAVADLNDWTIATQNFTTHWPSQLEGVWYVVGVADRFQPPDAIMCTRYHYSVGENGDMHHVTAAYVAYNATRRSWVSVKLFGNAYNLSIPGAYREWPETVVPSGVDPHDAQWFDPIVHLGVDFTDVSNTLLVKWGCTKPPLGNFQYIEVLSRKQNVSWLAVENAVGHLKDDSTPNIANLRPVSQQNCVFPRRHGAGGMVAQFI